MSTQASASISEPGMFAQPCKTTEWPITLSPKGQTLYGTPWDPENPNHKVSEGSLTSLPGGKDILKEAYELMVRRRQRRNEIGYQDYQSGELEGSYPQQIYHHPHDQKDVTKADYGRSDRGLVTPNKEEQEAELGETGLSAERVEQEQAKRAYGLNIMGGSTMPMGQVGILHVSDSRVHNQ